VGGQDPKAILVRAQEGAVIFTEDFWAALRGVPSDAPAILMARSPDAVVDYDVHLR
jgi:hypothetical protein